MQPETTETRDTLEEIFRGIWPRLTERERRLFAASEARKWGYGGISLVSCICGLSRATISKGLRELDGPPIAENRIRRPGAGRPNLVKSDPEIIALLELRITGAGHAPGAAGPSGAAPSEPGAATLPPEGSAAPEEGSPDFGERPETPEFFMTPESGTAFSGGAPAASPAPAGGPAAGGGAAALSGGDESASGWAGDVPSGHALSWTLKSTRTLARELSDAKHPISYVKVGQILKGMGYSLKGNKKSGKERSRSDSEAQYCALDLEARAALSDGRPLVHLESRSARGEGFDFSSARSVRAWAGPGAFAAGLMGRWWEAEGRGLYPEAGGALVTVYDSPGGLFAGDEAARALEELASAMGVPVKVLFFPAGTHRWNFPARELFSYITPPAGSAVPRRSVVRASLVAPAGPAAGWTAGSYSVEPGPGTSARRDGGSARDVSGTASGDSAAGSGARAGGWGFVVEP
ncbi:MAG: hypothetical protein LBQ79_12420 [Deltaproteobacteria bacterium]|nr:hypothetical protein [Deltaproteobacteria bacterium]